MDDKAQISAEFLILLAALLAVAFIIISKLSTTAKGATEKMGEKYDDLMAEIDNITK